MSSLENTDLATGETVELPAPTRLEQARETLGYIAFHKEALAAHKKLAAETAAKIQERIDHHERNLGVLASLLKKEYGKSTTELPGGGSCTVTTKKGDFVIADKTKATAFAVGLQDDGVDVFNAPTISKSALRKVLKEMDDGSLVDVRTGEVVEFATIEGKGEESLSYKLPKEETE